jgi:serine/threonine protein kinase/tetratricopeptide (TPR) repeat protein
MKTFAPGLSDSIASVIDDPRPCPHCDSSSHIAGGLCVGCLLEAGLDPADESESEPLTDILAEINLPDQNWRLGNYEILEEIGRGGMGVIYRARQRHSRRIVAVKRVLSYHSDSRETLARFRREAQAAASLDHPNILPIYEVSESEDGLPFFSMKFAPGGTLQQVAPALRSEPRQCVALVAKIARAVQYAHSRGILHRDLKPGNILLDGRGEPLVSDFGLAKWLDTTSDLTRTLTIFGTPGYIAPEQASASAAELKPTADIYSLGAILFDLLAGRPPFLGAHALSVIRQAAELPAPKLRTLSKIADRDLETICSRCLEREPTLRYSSAHDLADDLKRWLEGRPIIARPVSLFTRAWRFSRRNPLLVGFALAIFLSGVLIVAGYLQRNRLSKVVAEDVAIRHSIVVLPILNLDRITTDRDLAKNLSSMLQVSMKRFGPSRVVPIAGEESTMLALGGDSAVISRTARALNSRSILAITKRNDGDRMRIAVRLMDGSTGDLISRQIVNLGIGESLSDRLPPLISRDLYAALDATDLSKLRLSENDPGMRDSRTRELLISGRNLQDRRNTSDVLHAVDCFKKAVALQPDSAIAHSSLAMAQIFLIRYQNDRGYVASADTSVQRALQLNPDLGQTHCAQATIYYYKGDFQKALAELFTAYELGDVHRRAANLAGDIYKTLGRPDHAVLWYELGRQVASNPRENDFIIADCRADLVDDERAALGYTTASELFPYMPEGWMGLCRLALLQKNFALAKKICADNWMRYRDSTYSGDMAAQVYFFARDFPEAEKLYTAFAAKDPDGGETFYACVSYKSALGRLRMATGDEEGAKRILGEALARELRALQSAPQHPEILYRLAAIESTLNHVDDALAHLKAATEAGWIDYRSLALDPRFDNLRNDLRYRKISEVMATRVETLRRSMPTD